MDDDRPYSPYNTSSSSLPRLSCMKPIRILLVDDERIGRSRLRRMLERDPLLEVVGECADGTAAVKAVRELRPDLCFLDINMPGMDGFDVLDSLRPEDQPAVIFVTAYDEHAVRAFEAAALDYLLKPVSPERLKKTLDRARARLDAGITFPPETSATALAVPRSSGASAGSGRFVVRSGGKVSFVAVEEIDWIEAAGNYAIFHVGTKSHMVRETMSGLEMQLPADGFMRVSRSTIVNLRRVKELCSQPVGAHAAVLVDAQRVPITRSLREVADRLSAL
jgi:two-component system, LytTR family, response regulator